MEKRDAPRPGGGAWRRAALLAALVALCGVLRAARLGWPPLWADEAESAINALTILDRGLPIDRYRGLPLFENTLVRPWPESEEYEFRDISYSDRGLAIYHGWLPLYAIAGAFRVAGVTPEAARRGPPLADASTAELVRWTAVPRWPAVAFSAALVLFAFALGRAAAGEGAGWAMALAASVSNIFVFLGRQARYYSPTLALNAASGLAVWNACRRGRVRDHALAGLAIGLLFHTHALSGVVMSLVFAAALPFAREQALLLPKLALAGSVGALLVLPWAWWSGFLAQTAHIPSARGLLDLHALLPSLRPSSDLLVLLVSAFGLSWLLLAALPGPRIPDRWRRPILDLAPGLCFAVAWTVLAYLGFVALVPAASYSVLKLKLSVAVAGLLAITVVVTALSRAFLPSAGPALPSLAMIVLLALIGQVRLGIPQRDPAASEHEVPRLIRSWSLRSGARLYAAPNSHFLLTYYSGLPVQSVGAVRRSWLDGFDRDLVILEPPRYEAIPADEVTALAAARGLTVSAEQAATLGQEAPRMATVLDIAPHVGGVDPRPRALDALELELVAATRALTRRATSAASWGTPMARATMLGNWNEFWQFFFFRFADPRGRMGRSVNFAERARLGNAYVLPGGWVVYDCRPSGGPPLVPSH